MASKLSGASRHFCAEQAVASPSVWNAEPTDEETEMSETWSGEFYCVKCKAKREATGEVHVSDKGTKMAKGICPVCSTKLNRILGKA